METYDNENIGSKEGFFLTWFTHWSLEGLAIILIKILIFELLSRVDIFSISSIIALRQM